MVFYWQVRGDTIHTQFKKGVLELLVLCIVRDKDIYGYELVEKVREIIDVNEGTIYPILKRLTNGSEVLSDYSAWNSTSRKSFG